jgi:O-antigen/teichoic acid export membrane protein
MTGGSNVAGGAVHPLLDPFLELGTDSLSYLVGAGLLGFGNLLLIPILTRNLSPEQFGAYALVDIALLVTVMVSQMGLPVSYLKWFSDIASSDRGRLLGSSLAAGGMAACILGVVLSSAATTPVGSSVLRVQEMGAYVWLFAPIVLVENLQGLLLSDLRARRKPFAYVVSGAVRVATSVLASLWLLVYLGLGLRGVFAARAIGSCVGMLVSWMFCHKSSGLRVDSALAGGMARFGFPLVSSALMAQLLDASGRYFISNTSNLDQVGYYAAAIKISGLFQFLVYQPFGVAWGGLMFQIKKRAMAELVYSKLLEYLLILSSALGLILVGLSPAFFRILTAPQYSAAASVFPLVVLVRVANIMEYPTSIGLYLGGKTRQFPRIYAAGLAFNLGANALLTPRYGMFGAALAWLVGWLAITGLMAARGQKYYALAYEWHLILAPCAGWLLLLVMELQRAAGFLSEHLESLATLVLLVALLALVVRDFRATTRRVGMVAPGHIAHSQDGP